MANTYVADVDGAVAGSFTIPPHVPAGTKLVEFVGEATRAQASFVGRGTLKIEDLRVVNTQINRRLLTWVGDPLAQTFMLGESRQVSAIDLWFTAIGTTNVLVQIREVVQGLPSLDIITEAILSPAAITAQMAANGYVRFDLRPVYLDADHEYCFVVACDDAVSALAVAGIGEFDAASNTWVTAQPYQVGVLLSSSNNRTWTAHQTRDLKFRLLAFSVDPAHLTKTIVLTPLTVTDADHLVVLAIVERPTPDCDVIFNLIVGAHTYPVVEGQPVTLAARYSGTLEIEAVLTGSVTASPVLHRDITIVAGKRLASSEYISRQLFTDRGASTEVDIAAYYDADLPAGSTCTPYYQSGETPQGAPVWTELTAPATLNQGVTVLANTWSEYKRVAAAPFTGTHTRIKLALTGTALALPRIRNLRVAIT